MSLQAILYKRDFTMAVMPSVLPRVISYSHSVIGGPKIATLEATADRRILLDYLNQLRAPVEITNEHGQKVWWGYVSEVSLQLGSVSVGVSLDTMSNKIAVVYSLIEPGSETVGTRATTAYVTDDTSIAQYGTKELLASISGATAAQAEQARNILLAQKKYPTPTVSISGQGESRVTLHCCGWWDTLGWMYYANSGTTGVETTEQIAAIVTACGQFMTETDISVISGILPSEYRDGDTTALVEILDLLKTGTSYGSMRYLSQVTPERVVRIYAEPLVTAYQYILTRDGKIASITGTQIDKKLCRVGEWVKVQELVDYNMGLIADPTYFFIEEAEYNADSDSLRIQPRGIPNAFDVITQLQGAE